MDAEGDYGLVWPPDFKFRARKIGVAMAAAQMIAWICPQRRVVVQAGGCAGLWPRALAAHFEAVYTFEPDEQNFDCLTRNTAGTPNIYKHDCALSDRRGTTGLARPKAGAGLWHLAGDGDIEVVTLDWFLIDCRPDVPVDALALDVEGSEPAVLRGAERTIARHRPLLWFEYLHNQEAIAEWLTGHGYGPPRPGLGPDWYSLPL